jgi:hypothetical protein
MTKVTVTIETANSRTSDVMTLDAALAFRREMIRRIPSAVVTIVIIKD